MLVAYRIIDPQVIRESGQRRDRVFPYSEWLPITENTTQRKIPEPKLLIFHTEGGATKATRYQLQAYCERGDDAGEEPGVPEATETEPTWILDMDGGCLQIMDVDTMAHTNVYANDKANAVECQDLGANTDPGLTTPYTPEQVEILAAIGAWKHWRNGTPLVRCTSQDGPGLAVHRMFPSWSSRHPNICPGDARAAQLDTIIALSNQIVQDGQEDPNMPTADEIRQIVREEIDKAFTGDDKPRRSLVNAIWNNEILNRLQSTPDKKAKIQVDAALSLIHEDAQRGREAANHAKSSAAGAETQARAASANSLAARNAADDAKAAATAAKNAALVARDSAKAAQAAAEKAAAGGVTEWTLTAGGSITPAPPSTPPEPGDDTTDQ